MTLEDGNVKSQLNSGNHAVGIGGIVVESGYKLTEVGVIPEDWEVKSVKEMGNPVRGGSPRPAGDPKYFDGSYLPWLTVAALTNIRESQIILLETATSLTEEGALQSRTLQPGTLIIANSGATLGVAKILGIKCCANDGIAALLDVSNDISAFYLTYFINTRTKYLREVVATGNGQPNLNTELIGNFKIPLPPSRIEQESIVEALSDADALIESLEQLITKKRLIKQGAMQELLTGRKRLPGFSGEWERRFLREICKMKSGESITCLDIDEYSPFPCYGGNGLRGFTKSYTHDGNYALIGRQGALCGNVTQVKGKFFASEHAIVVTPGENIDIDWLAVILIRMNLNQYSESSAQPGLSVSKILEFPCIVPTMVEQTAISNILSDMDTEIATLETKLSKVRQVKQGMMQQLLTGKIRLI